MTRVLVVATSKKTHGGITSVLKLYEHSELWNKYSCKWVGTHRDGYKLRKILYVIRALFLYLIYLPFYDIVHIHFSTSVSAKRKYPFFRLAKLLRKKTVIHLHCGSQIDEIWSPIYQTMFEQCDCGIVLSESLKQKVEEHIGKNDKICVVYNPCPIISHEKQFKKRNYILFSGSLIITKGYKDLIEAFSLVAAKYPDWKVVFAGNGEIDKAKAFAHELGVINQVEFLGWVNGEAKHKAFSEAKALCLPSYAEGFPMAVLDAWAYGLPVITTPVGGVPDVAIDGKNMLLFNPGDVKALSAKLERIISNKNLQNELTTSSHLLANRQFNIDTITSQVASIYDSISNK